MGTSLHSTHSHKVEAEHDELPRNFAEERALALRAARAADPGPAVTTFRFWQYITIVVIACCASGDGGFDGTIIGSINSMPSFQNYFGLGENDPRATGTGIVFGIMTVGSVCGFFPQIWIPDRFGRRWAQFIGNGIVVIGAIVNGLAHNFGMLIAGRFLIGFGSTFATNSAKAYLAEISNPWSRGLALGMQNSSWYIGNIIAAGVSIPFGRMMGPTGQPDNNWAWRAPFLLQMAMALPNFFFILWCPESPRWLYAQGRKDEAIAVIAKLHSRDGDVNSPLVQLQVAELEEAISVDGADKRIWDFSPIFRTKADRYRFGMCLIVACWGQLSGNGMVSYFLPTLLKQAGITSDDRQRVLNLASSLISMAGAMTGAALIDHFGRRPLMLGAEIWAVVGLAIITGLTHPGGVHNTLRANAGITFILMWSVWFSFGWTPLQGLYPTEVLAYSVRAKGLALQSWFANIFSLINTFGLPSALKALSWKMYLIFMAWDIVGCVVIYLWVVETKQLTLEELDEVFEAPHPKQKSLEMVKEAKQRVRAERAALANRV